MARLPNSEHSPVLMTKLFPPKKQPDLLERPRLKGWIAQARDKKLVAVIAPAGYGKSTFLTLMIEEINRATAWVSLEESDHDPWRFFATLIEAIVLMGTIDMKRTLAVLGFSVEKELDALLYALLTDLRESETPFRLMFDDFHVIQNPQIHQAMATLLVQLPEHGQLVIASRQSLPFSLSRLRAQGLVLLIGIEELRFTSSECHDFFYQLVPLPIQTKVVEQIGKLTEGWILGLKMAAMVLQQEPIVASKWLEFSGRHRLINDFLYEEVMEALPPELQAFLMDTSILDRINGDLCRAVTGQEDAILKWQTIMQMNTFIIALDQEGEWFRYHHLFSSFLRQRLEQMDRDRERQLHLRAAHWYEKHGDIHNAIEHGLIAQEDHLVLALLEKNSTQLLRQGEYDTLLSWFTRLSQDHIDEHVMASILYGWVLTMFNRFEPALQVMAKLEQTVQQIPPSAQRDEFLVEMYVLRGYIAVMQRHTSVAIENFTQSVQLSPKFSRFFRYGLQFNRGEPSVLSSRIGMRGYLLSAHELYTKLRVLWKYSGLAILGYGSIILGELHYEWNELAELEYFIPRGIELGKRAQDPGVLVPIYLLYAKVLWVSGRHEAMWRNFDEIEKWLRHEGFDGHWLDILKAFQVRMWMEEEQQEAVYAYHEANVDKQNETVAAVGDFRMITLARVFIFMKKWKNASSLLAKIMHYAETQDQLMIKIEVGLLQAITYHHLQKEEEVRAILIQTLRWGSKESYLRTFLDQGEALFTLLRPLLKQQKGLSQEELAYGNDILAKYEEQRRSNPAKKEAQRPLVSTSTGTSLQSEVKVGTTSKVVNGEEPEPLTKRDLEILDGLSIGMSNADLASLLGLSIGTIKVYVHHLYGKLGVTSRAQAVLKAREQNLLQ